MNNFLLGFILGIITLLLLHDETDYKNRFDTIIRILTRQAARWSTAAKQDKNSMISVLHANYGAGYLWAIKDIATDKEIKDVTGIDMKKFTLEIVKIQDKSNRKMVRLCPKYAPRRSYLTSIGGE